VHLRYYLLTTHTRARASHFPGKPMLAVCPLEVRVVVRNFTSQISFLTSSSRSTHWASPFLHRLRLLEGSDVTFWSSIFTGLSTYRLSAHWRLARISWFIPILTRSPAHYVPIPTLSRQNLKLSVIVKVSVFDIYNYTVDSVGFLPAETCFFHARGLNWF